MSAAGAPGRPQRRAFCRALLTAFLGGCAGLPRPGPAPRVYRLSPKTTFPAELPRADWSLAVAEPLAERALDTDRIAVVRGGFEVLYFAGVLWSDRVPAMLQLLIVQSFLASGALAAVGTDRDIFRPDYLLRPVLHAFQVQERPKQGRVARVSFSASLLRMPRRRIVGVRRFAEEQAVSERSMAAIVRAFDEALGKVLKRLVIWTIETGQNDRRAGGGEAGADLL